MNARGLRFACLSAGLFLAHPAAAHQMNLSNARIEVGADRRVQLEVALKGSDVDRAAKTSVFDGRTGLVDAAKLAAATAPIAAYIVAHAVVRGGDGAPCAAGPVQTANDKDGVIARFAWACPQARGGLVYRSTVLTDIDPAARQIVLIGHGPDAPQALLDAAQTELQLDAPPPALWEVVTRYARAGIEHIFLGYDHIAFLIAIVLWARRLWPVVKIVTAFTIAHSITLSLAALHIVVVPSSIVEPLVAASIVWVAAENFFSRNVDKRWRDTFAFGLVHGFGFASALQEFGLPRGAVLPALAAFNVGVELGQIAIVAAVLPILMGFDRVFVTRAGEQPRRPAALVHTLSAVIGALGCWWILARTVLARG